jgi:regulator of sirC expression with transglutaminase-like and TPR domain
VERYQRLLDQHGRELKRLLVDVEYPKDRIGIIGAYLCETHGFSGNTTDYYDPDNSLLSRVIDSRHGIPISLTLLYMIVGARAGMRIEGVNLPGHFLAKHDGILFDPFENGRIVMLSDCNAILARQNLTFSPDHFEVASPRMMLRRTLANLLYIYQNDGGEQQASRLAEWIKGLERN